MTHNFTNLSKTTQGNHGLGCAIAWFTLQNYIVAIPLNDNQTYDLLVDKDGAISRVQVKTTGFKRRGGYVAQIKSTRHNMKDFKTNLFEANSCDLLYILVEDGGQYLIPSSEITAKHELALRKYEKYKVA